MTSSETRRSIASQPSGISSLFSNIISRHTERSPQLAVSFILATHSPDVCFWHIADIRCAAKVCRLLGAQRTNGGVGLHARLNATRGNGQRRECRLIDNGRKVAGFPL